MFYSDTVVEFGDRKFKIIAYSIPRPYDWVISTLTGDVIRLGVMPSHENRFILKEIVK